MTKEEVAKKIILQEGNCNGVDCSDCIENKDGENPCDYAENLGLESGDKEYRKAKAEFCKQWLKENNMKLEVTTDYKDPKWCEVRDFEDDEWEKAILIADNSTLNLEYPYSIVQHLDEKAFLNGEKVNIVLRRRFARPIPKKEYKPYSEPKLEWIGKIVKDKKSGKKLNIENITRNLATDELVLSLMQQSTGDIFYTTMQEFLDTCTWLDGSVCGEEKNNG